MATMEDAAPVLNSNNDTSPPLEPVPAEDSRPKPPALPTTSDRLRLFQDSALKFLSNASNGALGACAIGLCASTYLVLGRIGLVLIGAVGGVVLHATWEAQADHGVGEGSDSAQDGGRRRKELGIEVAKRALDWRDLKKSVDSRVEKSGQVDEEKAGSTTPNKPLDFSDFQPETRIALTNFSDAVIRDYVKWWYGPILPTEESFPAACRQTLSTFIVSFSTHLSRKRNADPFLDFLANSTSIIIVFLNELSSALKASQRQDAEEAIRTYLKYQPESNLANVLSTEQQERKLNLVADDILQNFLDSKSYNCPPVKSFLQEILSGLILQMTVTSCSKPEWINGWIVYLLEDGEPELMNVIDAGIENTTRTLERIPSDASGSRQGHQRRVSRAEEAMQQAMMEAQRLNEMIAEEEAKRKRGTTASDADDAFSTTTTEAGIATPTSSDSGRHLHVEAPMDSSMVFDSEGNAMPSATPSPMKEQKAFMNADQLSNPSVLPALQTTYVPPAPTEVMVAVPLTLHNASITILDMGDGNDRATLKQKPTSEYLVQIEPASSRFPGWMISRRYPDFEPLHETIRRIATISGVPEFAQQHASLPTWRGQTRASLIPALETYLRHALKYESLAESEAMKKFLEKETGLEKAPAQAKNVLVQGGAALENVGKGFINVLGQGGKGIAGGGKAVLGGVQGVFGAVTTGVGGPKKVSPAPKARQPLPRTDTGSSISRISQDLPRASTESSEAGRAPPLPARVSSVTSSIEKLPESYSSQDSSARWSAESLHLPPPPSEITDEYNPVASETPPRLPARPSSHPVTPTSATRPELDRLSVAKTPITPAKAPTKAAKNNKANTPITEEETRVSIELMFAIITELYSLSSAWTIRLSLLSAAKTFLLRPNNPQLESIRLLLQDSVIDANFSDAGLAAHINKLRENTLPTEEERAAWPKEMTAEEKEKLRVKARRLLVERGMPQALTSVMGAVASGEALGRVFDCLQVEEVARGLIFALLLQAIRAATQ